MSKSSRLSLGVLAAYSGVSAPLAAMAMPVAVYLPVLYAEGFGLELGTVGLIFTLARVWDFVTDPVMGLVIDRYDTRWGRRKHWIAISIPILMVSVYMVFIPDADNVSPLYLMVWLLALYVGYTMLSIAHQSWGAELAVSYDDRSRLFGWREIFVIAGMAMVLAIPVFVDFFGSGQHVDKVASMGWYCIVVFPLTLIPTLLYVPDSRAKTQLTIDWKEAVRLIVSNITLWRLLLADLAAGFGTAVSGALYILMATYVFDAGKIASAALFAYFAASFIAMPFWMKVAYRWGKDKAMRIALIYGALCNCVLIPLAGPGENVVLWVFTILYGIAFGAAPTLLRSMMADLTDEDELQHGSKRAGLFFALLTTTNKLGAAVGVGVSFMVLDYVFGFVPRAENSVAAIDGLLFTYALGTALGLVLAYFAVVRYPLTRDKHEAIREELARVGESA